MGVHRRVNAVCSRVFLEGVVADKKPEESEDKPSKADGWRSKLEASKARAREDRLSREQSRSEMYEGDPNRAELFGSSGNQDRATGPAKGQLGDAMAKNQSMLSENMRAVSARTDELNIQAQQSGQLANSGAQFASRSRAIKDLYK